MTWSASWLGSPPSPWKGVWESLAPSWARHPTLVAPVLAWGASLPLALCLRIAAGVEAGTAAGTTGVGVGVEARVLGVGRRRWIWLGPKVQASAGRAGQPASWEVDL